MKFSKISTAGLYKDEWMILRQGGIGGSEAGAVCGVNPYVSPIDVYRSKVEDITEDEEEKEAVRIGHDFEEYVAKRFSEATGLRLHDLRHSHASLLISKLGAQPNLVAERLGHEKINTTLNIYSHLYPNQSRDLADQLNNLQSDDVKEDDSGAGDT